MTKVAAEPPDLNTIGGRLRWARERYHKPDGEGLASMRKAAKFFGWSESTYKSHELGIRRSDNLPTDVAEKYARAYRINVSWLLTGRGDPLAANEPKGVKRAKAADSLRRA